MSDAKPSSELQFSSALSTLFDASAAIAEASAAAKRLDGPADLGVFFISHHHSDAFGSIASDLRAAVGARHLIGCTGESIVGVGREIEGQPALSLWLARLPGVNLTPFCLEFTPTGAEEASFLGWPDNLVEDWPENAHLLALADPFTFPADEWLRRLNDEHPGVFAVGGMASGAWQPGQNKLFLDDQSYDAGAVVVGLDGAVRLRTVVSQGCRPIGRPFVITKAHHNVIEHLGGKPALAQLQEVIASLDEREQELIRHGLHVGRVIDEYKDHFGRGDFLVRNLMGADSKSGAIAIGDLVRPGQTVQFHVRDANTADEDLRELLASANVGPANVGALLFTCNGRGSRLFPGPHHDANALRGALGDIPVAGFFAQGEMGPIGGKNFLHGFTASVAIFAPE